MGGNLKKFSWTVLSVGLLLNASVLLARKSKEIKEAERAAYWGVIADVYRANFNLARPNPDPRKISRILTQAVGHLRAVDQTAAPAFLALGRDFEAIDRLVSGGNLPEAKTRLRDLQRSLISEYAAHVAPVLPPDKSQGGALFTEYCSGCHGDGRDVRGKLARSLKVAPEPLAGKVERDVLSPFAVYAVGIHGADQSEMTSMLDIIDIDQLWSIAFYVAAMGHDPRGAPDGFLGWLENHKSDFSLAALAVGTDVELVGKLAALGWSCGLCADEVSFLRGQWAFSGSVTRLGDVALSPREATEHRALVLLLVSIILVSALFVFVLRSRR